VATALAIGIIFAANFDLLLQPAMLVLSLLTQLVQQVARAPALKLCDVQCNVDRLSVTECMQCNLASQHAQQACTWTRQRVV
jgi:hypothetical protein